MRGACSPRRRRRRRARRRSRRAPPPPPLTAGEHLEPRSFDRRPGGRSSFGPTPRRNHVERIKTLTRQGFYNGLAFFRVIEGFMAQGGDPQNNGTGGSTLPDLNGRDQRPAPRPRRASAMARAQDPNSANSQFYIMFVPRLQMDRKYTVFGRVVERHELCRRDRARRAAAGAEPDRPRLARHRQCRRR